MKKNPISCSVCDGGGSSAGIPGTDRSCRVDGRRVNRPCENIIIRNNQMLEVHGAIVIGSGMSGGVRNVYASSNQIQGGMWGIRIKSMRGRGGYIKDIWMEDMEISNIRRWSQGFI